MDELKVLILNRCKSLNFKHLATDFSHFLFNPSDSKKLLLFTEYIKGF